MVGPYQAVPSDSPPQSPTFHPTQYPQIKIEEVELRSLTAASCEKVESDRTQVHIPREDGTPPRAVTAEDQPTGITEVATGETPQYSSVNEVAGDSPDAAGSSSQDSLPAKIPHSAAVAAYLPDISKDETTMTVLAVDESLQHAQHTASAPQPHQIFWRSRPLMISCFILGLAASVGHHLFYWHLNDTIVPSSNNAQEWNTGIGILFAFVVKISLAASVWFAYTQWLWKRLREKHIPLRVLDLAFHAGNSMIALLDPGMISILKVASALALIAWCLQIPGWITPETLIVVPSSQALYVEAPVPSLDIANCSQSHTFAYFTNSYPITTSACGNSSIFNGPRSIVTRLSTATASFGQILPITPPFIQSSYSLQIYGPYVNCSLANSTVQEAMDAYLGKLNSALSEASSGGLREQFAYAGFVPSFDVDPSGTNTIPFEGINITALDQPRLQQQPGNATNEIWLYYYRYSIDASSSYVLDANQTDQNYLTPQYSVCSLSNATYDLNFTFDNGQQNVTSNSISPINAVAYPTYGTIDFIGISYSAFFWVLADQVVGTMGVISTTNGSGSYPYGSIDTNMEHNSLLGSNDLDYFFDLNSAADNSSEWPLSDQRINDKALAQNQTLPYLIQQLSFNMTVSLMSDPLLAPPVTVNTTQINPVNRYYYNARNLWLAYGLANYFALLSVILGILAFKHNDASHSNSLSNVMSICQDPELGEIFPRCCRGVYPLPEETMKTKLKLVEDEKLGGQSLKPEGQEKVVCKVCNRESQAALAPQSTQRARRPSRLNSMVSMLSRRMIRTS